MTIREEMRILEIDDENEIEVFREGHTELFPKKFLDCQVINRMPSSDGKIIFFI